ncbi:MAG: Ig-like domain-containing protein [Lachnospiraceae bacterium]|nr:Ig-like domain-containing protein [Lachnospiraceae bacterium]
MLKGKLLKRVMPFLLSMAMAFQSVPMTALAVEDPQAAMLTEEADATVDPEAGATEGSSDLSSDEETKSEEAAETDTESPENQENPEEAAGTETGEYTETAPAGEDASEPGDAAAEPQVTVNSTEIIVNDSALSGFTREHGASSLTYTTSYSETDQFGSVMSTVKNEAVIYVNDERADDLKNDYLNLEWREAGKTEAMTGTPQNVGSYVLHLETRAQEGVCAKAEKDVYFNITPKELKVSVADSDKSVKAGGKVTDYKDTVTKAVVLKDGSSDFTALQYTAAVEVYELKDGAGEVTADAVFNKNKDYRVKVEVTFADAEAAKNYEVTDREFPVTFGNLLQTKVEIGNPGKEMVETYDKNTTYTASAIAEKYGVTAEVKRKDDDEPLEGAAAAAKWYTKEMNQSGINGFPTPVDGITQFLDGSALYTLMTAEKEDEEAVIGDVGDYYLVFVYEGVDGQYEKSHSNPLKVTIDPIEVILKPTAVAELNPAMTVAEINSVLAQVESKLFVPDTDPTLASETASDAPVADKDFYGVSYDNANVTQYYSPVFELVCKTRTKLQNPPAGATGDALWSDWSAPESAAAIAKDTDERQYTYYIRFTGKKAVYTTAGNKTSERPITEATDAANRNYKVKTDADTLNNEKNMLKVELGETKETSIDVSGIIEEFTGNGRGKDREGQGKGLTADDPAWTIYDPDLAMFADKASYKKAVVKEKDTDNGLNPEVKDTDKDLTYTWQTSNALNVYNEITRMEKNTGETDEDFAKRRKDAVEALENTFSGSSVTIPQAAGLYRLRITYKDTSLVPKNAPAEGYAYFLIKKQELVFAADMQYANYDDSVWNFEKKDNYRVFALPDNDESKIDWEKPLGWYTGNVTWQAMNLKKNTDGSNGIEWEKSTGTFVKNDTNPYVYKAAVWLRDGVSAQIKDTDNNVVKNQAGTALYWSNYTTRNMAVWDADNGEYKQRYKVGDGYGDIKFDAAEIKIVVDRTKLFDDKIYDAKPIAEQLPEGFVKLTDTDGAEITDLRINGEPTGGVGVVNVAWKWNDGATVSTGKAIFGGDYTLVAWFEGNDKYAPYDYEELEDKDGSFTFTIDPLKVEITPVLKEEATAGDRLSEMLDDGQIDVKAARAEEIPEEDVWLFVKGYGKRWNAISDSEYDYTGYPILRNGVFTKKYYENNIEKTNTNDRIRYGRDYVVEFDNYNSDLYAQYATSYDLIYKPAALAKINRGDADVKRIQFVREERSNGAAFLGVSVYRTDKSETGYQIVPLEGIPFVYADGSSYKYALVNHSGTVVTADILTNENIPLDKNYIAVNLVSPREFAGELAGGNIFAMNNFVYGNSIKAAGGYVIDKYLASDEESVRRYYITALFPVELDESGKVKEIPAFSVTWETGYTDTFQFDLTNAKVEANLKRAVAPKSLAFNAVKAKMAVGEEQQLDVKITKAQLGDVVRINYRLAGGMTSNDYASINPETGVITALATNNKKPVAVNVEAYPVRLAEDGKTFEEITGKGVKVAKTKVTITEVTAPVIKKVIPKDTSAEIQFTKVDDGYRGEIYVVKLENKKDANKWKPANFEDAIKEMKNGQWKGTFAIQPQYLTGSRGYNETLKLCRQLISPLEKGAYVVYVRNVSAVRTLADGSKVTESAAGTVKMFETTKSLVRELRPYFEVTDEKSKANPVRYTDENQKDIENKSNRGYTIELADKSAQLLVDGKFNEKATNDAADSGDSVWYQLSLKVAEKALGIKLTDTYQDPKLNYYVTDNETPRFDGKGKITNPSKYVTINNKGKLTLKGVDRNGDVTVRIYVADSSTLYRNNNVYDNRNACYYSLSGSCDLTITARPDTLTTKKVKPMKVGDAIRLKDYLEYKSGKAKVPNFWSSAIEITNRSEVEEAGFEIYQAQSNGATHPSIEGTLRKDEYIIIAKKAGAKCDLKLKDWLWKTAGSDQKTQTDEVKISLSTAKLDAVKRLKAVYTDDKNITLNFAHAGHPEAFDIEVKDARGSVVYKRLAYRDDVAVIPAEWHDYTGAYAWYKNALANLQRANLDKVNSFNGAAIGRFAYFEKTGTYAYTISTEKLMRLSSYTISVTPVYEGEIALKPAATKAKTTNIPASYGNGDIVNPNNNYTSSSGGISISNCTTYLTSGNTYTVTAGSINSLAQTRGTDTLTWKSSNAKVASVKANQGSFSATLKALSQGKTTITVTSKVTKKTIARYHIAVKAVGKAGHYGGDYETGGNGFYDDFIKTVDPYYEGRMEVLTISNSVTVDSEDYLNSSPSNDRTWVKFTAPSYGEYEFSCNRQFSIYYNSGSEGTNTQGNYKSLRLEEGQDIYFKIAGSFTLSVSSYTDFTKLTTAFTKEKPLTVNKAVWVSFTATEDNYYTFNSTGTLQFERNGSPIYPASGYNDDGWYAYEMGLKAGETIFVKISAGSLYVTKREFAKTLAAGAKETLSFNKDNQADAQYMRFTAGPAGEYSFTYKPSDKVDVAFLAVDGTTLYYDGDAVLAETGAAIYAEGAAETTEESETVKLFMDAGETVVIKVSVKAGQEITEDAAKIDVEISATAVGVKPLAAEQTVTKNTSEIFEYTIPNDKAAAKYTLTATEGAVVMWYDKQWKGFSFAGNSFTVTDGKIAGSSLKAGDKIYIKVTAAADKDSKVTLTSVTDSNTFDAAKPAAAELGKTGDAKWYTFTVKKAGYYEFMKNITVAPAESAAQTAEVKLVQKAFSETDAYVNGSMIDLTAGDNSGVRKLNAGDYVFMIKAASNAAEGVKTTVALSVKEIVPTAISGTTSVELAKGETKYYTFKRATDAEYTIKWTKDTASTGTADVTYTSGDLATGSYYALSSLSTTGNNTYIIKAAQTGENAVSGKLEITAAEKNFLTSGKAEPLDFAKDGSKEYKFTLPEDSALGYMVIVENTSVVPDGKTSPTIMVTSAGDGTIVNALSAKGKEIKEMTGWNKKFVTKTITITAADVTEAAEGVSAIKATGTITIRPITVNPFNASVGNVKKGDEPKWYTYTVPADGRYELDYAVGENQIKNSVQVSWYKKNNNGSRGSSVSTGSYLTKEQDLYIKVEANDTIAEAGVAVTLKPALLKATALTFADGKAEADVKAEDAANGAVYYTLKAPAYATYTVMLGENVVTGMKYYRPNENGSERSWHSGNILEKDDEILITVNAAGKLTVTQKTITELTLGKASEEITVKAGESADFVFHVFEDGYYDFTVDSSAADLIISEYGVYHSEKYFVVVLNRELGRYKFTITNNGGAEAKIKVTAGELTPVTLNPGENNVPVAKGRVSIVKFTVPEDYWYTVTCSEGSRLEGGLNEGEYFYNAGELSGILIYSGTEASATAKVTVAKVTPAPASGEKITGLTLEPCASTWYKYTTGKAGEYKFTTPAGARLFCYSSLSTDSSEVDIRVAAETDLYIRVVNDSAAEIENVDITVTCVAATELNVGENQLSNTSYSNTYMTFRAPADAEYSFVCSDGYLYYYGESAWQKESYAVNPYLIGKDRVVYLSVNAYSENITITVTKEKDVRLLDHVDVAAGKYQWITFKAPEYGDYTFFSANKTTGDPKAWFFKDQSVGDDADSSTLDDDSESRGYGNDDDAGGDRNFKKELTGLSAGEIVYIAVGYYNLNSPTECDVYVSY